MSGLAKYFDNKGARYVSVDPGYDDIEDLKNRFHKMGGDIVGGLMKRSISLAAELGKRYKQTEEDFDKSRKDNTGSLVAASMFRPLPFRDRTIDFAFSTRALSAALRDFDLISRV